MIPVTFSGGFAHPCIFVRPDMEVGDAVKAFDELLSLNALFRIRPAHLGPALIDGNEAVAVTAACVSLN